MTMQTMKAGAFESRRGLPAGAGVAVLACGGNLTLGQPTSLAALCAR